MLLNRADTAGPKMISPAMASTATRAMIKPYSTSPWARMGVSTTARCKNHASEAIRANRQPTRPQRRIGRGEVQEGACCPLLEDKYSPHYPAGGVEGRSPSGAKAPCET